MVLHSILGEEADVLSEQDFQTLVAVNLLAPLGIAPLSPLLSSLTGPLGVSSNRIGLLIAVYTAPPIVLIPVTGVLADRYGRKPILMGGILLFGTAGTAIAATTDFRIAVALRFLQGVGFAGLTPIVITSIGDLYTGTREAAAQGLRFTSSGVYQSIFPPITGILVGVSWRYPFLIYALAFPIAGLVYWTFDETLEPRSERSEVGRQTADDGPPGHRRGGIRRRSFGDLVQLVVRRRILALVFGRGLPMVSWIGFLTYNSLLVTWLMDGTTAQAGALVTINSIMMAVGGSQAGRIRSVFASDSWPLAGSHVGLGGGLAIVAVAPSLYVAAIGSALIGAGFGVSLSLYRSIMTGLAPPTLRGGLVSISESAGRITSTITPIGMGALVVVLTPLIGSVTAVRWTVVGVGGLVAVAGVLSLAVVLSAPPHDADLNEPN